jgi:AhpC/TSA family
LNLRRQGRQLAALVLSAAIWQFHSGCAFNRADDQAMAATGRSSWRLLDLSGQAVDPFQTADTRAVVFVFVSNDCPISNRYAPEIKRLHAKFVSRRVAFWLVHPDADETAEAIRQHAGDYQYRCGILRDPQHALVKKAKVRVTPEAAVFGPDRQLIYHGRIDNWYVDFGKERPAPTEHDLEEVLEAVLAGKPVRNRFSRAIGCYIAGTP